MARVVNNLSDCESLRNLTFYIQLRAFMNIIPCSLGRNLLPPLNTTSTALPMYYTFRIILIHMAKYACIFSAFLPCSLFVPRKNLCVKIFNLTTSGKFSSDKLIRTQRWNMKYWSSLSNHANRHAFPSTSNFQADRQLCAHSYGWRAFDAWIDAH